MPCGSIVNKATGQVCRPAGKKTARKKLSNINQNGIDYCKLETCTYNSFAAIWGLTAIDTQPIIKYKKTLHMYLRNYFAKVACRYYYV